MARSDSEGLARQDEWYSGERSVVPERDKNLILPPHVAVDGDLLKIFKKIEKGVLITKRMFWIYLIREVGNSAQSATLLMNLERTCAVMLSSFVVNRNINYTNVCYFKCQFCAILKGKMSENLRGKPIILSREEIKRDGLKRLGTGGF